MKIKPCGYYALVDITEVEKQTESGIILPELLTKKEQMAEQTGTVIAFGPTAYVGWKGCDKPDIPPYEQWGVKVGDKIEFRKFEGKESVVPGYENYRYIPDTHIVGVVYE